MDRLEETVTSQGRELEILRQRLSVAESGIADNSESNAHVSGTVLHHTHLLEGLDERVGAVEHSLTCSGAAELDVCGCGFGFTYYEGDCEPSDEKAAEKWIDDFNEEHGSEFSPRII